ncbi:MAG TPA: acyltransferase [Methylocystis sp.]|jgi:peptidoglycan/LPS O-acetylase OafA/YrhL
MSSPLKENRDAQLDELRGLAICAVLASHVALVFRNDFALARVFLVPALGVGVDLFFVISGFLIVDRAARSVAKAGGFRLGAAAFWASRVIRIGVPAWVTIGALYVAWRLGGLHGLRFEDLIAAAAFLGDFYWAPCFAGNEGCGDPLLSSHFWSLGIEAQFCALAPFLAALGRRSVWIIVASTLTAGALLSRPWGGFWWALRPDALLVGVLIGLETRRRAEWLKLIPKIGLGLATYWLLVAAVLARVLSIGGTGVGLVAVAVIFGMVVAGRGRDMGARAPFGAKPLCWMGERSFSIYLVHLPVLSGLRAALLEQAPPWAVAALATIGAVFAALCLERLVTRPSMVMARRVAARICDVNGTNASSRVEGPIAE